MFGGYDRYRAMQLLARHRWWLRHVPVQQVISPLADSPRSLRNRLLRLAHAGGPVETAGQYLRMIEIFKSDQIHRLVSNTEPIFESLQGWSAEHDPVHAAMRWDLTHYLPYDLLRKVDRASMAVALEVRCPMLDTSVCDLAGHLPAHVLMPGGHSKGLLREATARYLPASITQQSKRGFALPIGRWFRSSLQSTLQNYLLDGRLSKLGFHKPELEALVHEHTLAQADHTHRLFALLTLALWLDWLMESNT
ncbi:MAG: hypothetical protein HC898_13070 [Phycisphaerales bacterium]|nr:hypothetical protein [Phycisphaerales bacterium]